MTNGELPEGDCIKVLRTKIGDGTVDAVIADPPYGTTKCDWDSRIPLDDMWYQLWRVLKPTGVIVLTSSQPFTAILINSNPGDFKHEWIWIKNRGSNFANTKREPAKEHEHVLVFCRKGGWTYNMQMQERTGGGKSRSKYKASPPTASAIHNPIGQKRQPLSELRVPSSWQRFNTVTGAEKTKHPTQKPVDLMEYFIKTYTNVGDTVLDFVMGSGTTGVACRNLGRRFIGIERDRAYFQLAKGRITAAHGKLNKKRRRGERDTPEEAE